MGAGDDLEPFQRRFDFAALLTGCPMDFVNRKAMIRHHVVEPIAQLGLARRTAHFARFERGVEVSGSRGAQHDAGHEQPEDP